MRNPDYAVQRGNWWTKNASAGVFEEYLDGGEKNKTYLTGLCNLICTAQDSATYIIA